MIFGAMQPKDRGLVVDTLLTYIHADAACCREDVGPLAARQAEVCCSCIVIAPMIALARHAKVRHAHNCSGV